MSVILYKNGGSQLFGIDRYQNAIDNEGWQVEPVLKQDTKPEQDIVQEDESPDNKPNAPTFAEADTNNSGKLSPKEIREAARQAGIPNWDKARIKRLKKVLGYDS